MAAAPILQAGSIYAVGKTRELTPTVGIEIEGLDLRTIGVAAALKIEQLFNQHSAILFRDQRLQPDHLVQLSRQFGNLDEAPINERGKTAVDGFPEVDVVSNIKGEDGQPVGSLGAGDAAWHTDMSSLENPPRASLLHAVEIADEGGNTWLAGMYAALEAMPDTLRRRIENHRIKHDGTYNSTGLARQGITPNDDPMSCPGTLHPAICEHPDTGREVL